MQKISGMSRRSILLSACAAMILAFPASSSAANTESWTVGRGEANGKPIFVRINMAVKPADPKFQYRAVYAMNFLHPTMDGRPEKDETSKANEVEDQLNQMISQKDTGKFVAVQTHDGVRKFLFYVESEKVARDAESALKVPKDYKVALTVAADPSWVVYGKIRGEHERVHAKK